MLFFRIAPSLLTTNTHYENMMQLFNKSGYFCKTIPEIQTALKEALKVTDHPTIINVMINPSAERKPQTFSWLTESKL